MAYYFGSNTLGIRNPFIFEGYSRLVSGLLIVAVSVVPLLQVSSELQNSFLLAWLHVGVGLSLLVAGLKSAGRGVYQLFRYFVGRSVPTSLAYNKNPSECLNAAFESSAVAYHANDLESMLMGRKNTTFVEPIGWIARLVHTLFPSLIYTPYQIRTFVQELGAMVTNSFAGLIGFAVAYSLSISGLAGEGAKLFTPFLSILLLGYLLATWVVTAKSLSTLSNRSPRVKRATSLSIILGTSILLPIFAGYAYTRLDDASQLQVESIVNGLFVFNAWTNLTILIAICSVSIGAFFLLVRERMKLAVPTTEVAEFRSNIQEAVHPDEIFINIENIILANRRYKEVPNRIYQDLDPDLKEQSQGKGRFEGQLMIETQPEYTPISYSHAFKSSRMAATVLGQCFAVCAAILLLFTVDGAHSAFEAWHTANVTTVGGMTPVGSVLSHFITMLFAYLTVQCAASIVSRGAHIFWAELHFDSLLLWMNTKGTFTESKISTGAAIYDSTRSENMVVRSSITPWIITSRISTSTFATVGVQNLEMPRYILNFRKNDSELQSVVSELLDFLRKRETISTIRNENDLRNTATIYRLNEKAGSGKIRPAARVAAESVSDDESYAFAERERDSGSEVPR